MESLLENYATLSIWALQSHKHLKPTVINWLSFEINTADEMELLRLPYMTSGFCGDLMEAFLHLPRFFRVNFKA